MACKKDEVLVDGKCVKMKVEKVTATLYQGARCGYTRKVVSLKVADTLVRKSIKTR